MKIPFIDLTCQHEKIRDEIFSRWQELYDRTEFVYHRTCKDFEQQFASWNAARFACAFDSGTSAVEIALRAAGIGQGDEVITVANTFIATVAAIAFTGAQPVLTEIDDKTWNMDPERVEEKITRKTRAIIPVHLYGQPADMISLRQIARKNKLLIIADSAQAVGSALYEQGRWNNPASYADITTYSFYPTKNLGACGEGGAAVTNDPKFAEFMSMFRDHGSREKYIHEFIGRNNRMDALQAAALLIKMKYLEKWNEQRRQVASWYLQDLKMVEEIQLPFVPDFILPVYHLFVILVPEREAFQQYLARYGIGSALHYKLPVHLQQAFRHLNYRQGDLPITEAVVKRNISLPMFPELTRKKVKYITDTIKMFFTEKNN